MWAKGFGGAPYRGCSGRTAVVEVALTPGCHKVLCAEGTLAGQIKLRHIQAEMLQGAPQREQPEEAARTEAGKSWAFLGCSEQRAF